ncbi:ABC-2 type transport system ATP-binding protein [Marininema mesophilum]|uniref:ABC-2 type transport system ATP-binding protein n=1 Tax=Marininema mesophilum TaxID=1048340 RepID=A0A1H2S6Y2_9BACL|nr:ABC transporter ATP-binding protein [Marininema mesophilum]SDW27288.1 ABC-2 type transport system ATP-binding protein [Marininema mesophilum]
MEEALVIDHLQKSYDQKQALQGVTFSVKSGTCFGLLGPNGAGKSTTMKILTGIIEADRGSVHMLGIDASEKGKGLRQRVGYVPQSITLYEKLSAYDNLKFFGEMYGVRGKKLQQRIKEVLEQIGLKDRSKDAVETFSGGMKRRVNIAAALLHKPEVLILDEPTVGIDPQSRNHIFDMIRMLKKEGVTLIYSTHYMEEVEALCDDIAIIDHGKIIAQGHLHELLEEYSQRAIYVEAPTLKEPPTSPGAIRTYPQGEGWMIETEKLKETMLYFLNSDVGAKVTRLEIVRPSLESVFLSLTGTQLRD